MGLILSILMLAAIGFVIGAFLMWRRGVPMKQVVMMLILAAVAAVNVAIWTVPDKGGTSPLDRIDSDAIQAGQASGEEVPGGD